LTLTFAPLASSSLTPSKLPAFWAAILKAVLPLFAALTAAPLAEAGESSQDYPRSTSTPRSASLIGGGSGFLALYPVTRIQAASEWIAACKWGCAGLVGQVNVYLPDASLTASRSDCCIA
jgi:hypothetical protein